MSNNRNLGNIATAITNATSGQVLTSQGNGVATFADAAGGSSVTTVTNVSGASDSLTSISSPSVGDIVFVTSTNGLFIRKSNGWFKIADVTNAQPTDLTGVSDSALAIDGTATTITLAATDPEGLALTFSAAAKTGSSTTFSAALTDGNTVNALNGSTVIATVAQASNVFTITPNTASNDGTVDITFSVTDGINTALTDDGQFTLTFVTIVTDSNHTTLLATATPKNTTLYRYFKFIPQTMRSSSDFQISEFELTDGSSYYSPTSAQQLYRSDDSDGDDYSASQNVAASIDGNTSTKLYNGGWASKYYLYDMGSSFNTVLTGWRYVTGNDSNGRDPISWTLLGSTNNSDWVLLDQRVNETITTSRSTATQDFTFNATNQAFFNAANTNYPIEVNGDACANTFSPYRSGGYSTYFDGTGDYLSFANSSSFNLGASDFFIGFWVNPSSLTDYASVIGQNGTWVVEILSNTLRLWLSSGGGSFDLANAVVISNTLVVGDWTYVAIVRDSSANTLKSYQDGNLIYNNTNFTGTIGSSNQTLEVGAYNGSYLWNGYLRDVNLLIGTDLSSVSTTAPTEAVTTTSETSLLTCHLPYITDGSSNDHSITINGDPETKPFSPYDYNEYSVTDNGGSVYFDGNGDYLGLSDNSSFDLPNEFAWECWIYRKGNGSGGSGTYQAILGGNGSSSNGFTLYITQATGALSVFQSSFIITGSANDILDNQWSHILLMRDSSNLLQLFINGTRVSSSTNTTSFTDNSSGSGLRIGYDINANAAFNGYISDVRLFKGSTGGYSSGTSITVPTAPLSSSGAELHLKGTDASIIDKSQGANLKLVGTTAGSTTQAKFSNTKSMYFDGNSDYLTFPDRTELNFASNDWTIECWIYPKTNVGDCGIWHQSASGGTDWFSLYLDGSFNPKFVFKNNNAEEWTGTAAANTAPQNTWTHLALVRKFGTGVYLYAGGTLVASDTGDASVAMEDKTYNHVIGYERFVGNGTYFDGYIQDFRITNGLARYIDAQNPTTSFTPPSAPLEG